MRLKSNNMFAFSNMRKESPPFLNTISNRNDSVIILEIFA